MKNLILFPFLVACISSMPSIVAFGQDSHEVKVTEGTNMSVALSPDESTLAMALQGTIWILPRQGGKADAITDEMGDCHEPAWSPDGQQLVFHSYRDGNYHIYTINKDGSGLTQLTSGISDNREPHWSPDGSSVIFSSDRSGNYDIWKLDLNSRDLRQLTTDPANDSNPAFSSSGDKIAFVSQRENPGVYLLEEGKETLAIPTDLRVAAPSWSKDDNSLAYVAYTGRSMLFDDKNTSYIYMANLKEGTIEQLSADEDL
ncbi:MAG TPA: DPP IV N-terminal domain-containing protein, partial [Cyclobacteriaceae bacterium]|nr:DPP IV N-terminal domain-containing protein [Cyclobacteriaceae bacterium]